MNKDEVQSMFNQMADLQGKPRREVTDQEMFAIASIEAIDAAKATALGVCGSCGGNPCVCNQGFYASDCCEFCFNYSGYGNRWCGQCDPR